MTFGIDVSGYQAGIDFVRAKSEGVEFVIVKAVAAHQPAHTVADGYRAHVDAVTAAGLPKGHYLVVNSRNTPEQSARFIAENAHGYSGGDVIALDNEPLNTYATYWSDAECARFFRTLHAELGHPYSRMWLYCPAHLTRQNAPWPECEALGVKFWWVAYGGAPTGMIPDHEPSLQGSISRWDVHQFTDRSQVAGRSVDGNYSPHPVEDLFGGDEMGYLSHRPAKGNLNQGFGPRPKPTPSSPAIHYGQDYGWGGGDAIYAARDGIVLEYANVGAYGNRLILEHGNGRRTWYCHLSSALVRNGQAVKAGQQIAWMGATGNVTAKHLHFELRVNGVATDPEPYFQGSSVAGRDPIKVANVVKGNMMEIYVSAPNGVVVHIVGGAKHNFATIAEYTAWRSEVIRYKEKGWISPHALVPPALESLEKLKTWAEFERICKNFGAPVN